MSNRKGIYTIVDTLAKAQVGPIQLFRHEAPAVRFFSDVAGMQDSQVNLHPSDYALVRLGWLEDETLEITPEMAVIIDGQTWAAAQQPKETK